MPGADNLVPGDARLDDTQPLRLSSSAQACYPVGPCEEIRKCDRRRKFSTRCNHYNILGKERKDACARYLVNQIECIAADEGCGKHECVLEPDCVNQSNRKDSMEPETRRDHTGSTLAAEQEHVVDREELERWGILANQYLRDQYRPNFEDWQNEVARGK